MTRYWISWISEMEVENVPFQYWVTGYTASDSFTYVADLRAESEQAAFAKIAEYFPDYEYRFCNELSEDYQHGDRFQK